MPRHSASERNDSQRWKGAEIGAFAAFPSVVFSEEVTGQAHNARPSSDFPYFTVTLLGKPFSPLKNLHVSGIFSFYLPSSISVCFLHFTYFLAQSFILVTRSPVKGFAHHIETMQIILPAGYF